MIKQESYEYCKSKLADDSVINSLKILQTRYKAELSSKAAPGFIQFISISPFTVALWCEKDIQLFHEMSRQHCLVIDATGSVAIKINGKELFTSHFCLLIDHCKKNSVARTEILTEKATYNTLTFILQLFQKME